MTRIGLGMPLLPARAEAALADRPALPGLVDRHGRVATDLRVSLTDACNLRCGYCMPEEGLEFMPAAQRMSAAEIVRLAGLAVRELGVTEIRFTGGEPLLRADIVDIVAACAALQPRPELSLTTNAIGLAGRAAALAEAGLDRVNVSLDSLDPHTFATMTRRPFLRRVLEGIDALAQAGFTGTKLNAVLLPGLNDMQAPELLAWALERDLELRFIEQMPLDADGRWSREEMITAERIRQLLAGSYLLCPDEEPRDGAPAQRYLVRDAAAGAHGPVLGRVGIIASVTEDFCGDCRRTRLTADGRVRSCLFSHEETDLLGPLRAGASDAELAALWRGAMWLKPAGHGIDSGGFVQPARTMSAIGG